MLSDAETLQMETINKVEFVNIIQEKTSLPLVIIALN